MRPILEPTSVIPMSQSSKSALSSILASGFLLPSNPLLRSSTPPNLSFSGSAEDLSRPKTTRNAHSRGKQHDQSRNYGEEMYRKGLDSLQKRKEREVIEFNSKYSFAPAISDRSKELAKGIKRKPLYSAPDNAANSRESPRKTHFQQEKPISDLPIARKTVDLAAFLARNYERPQQKAKELVRDVSAERRKEQELKECTFRPKIDRKSEKMVKRGEGLYERALKTREKREKEVKREREERMTKELKECTFVPQLATPRTSSRKQVIIEPLPRLSESPQSAEEPE